jgi:D-glycero-alpha-D-manno-heptose-7-phosphate kinase
MFRYPHAAVSPIHVPNSVWWELERRLALIFLGRSHSSSEVHEMVIRHLEDAGPDSPQLEDLRGTPVLARDAIYAGDFEGLGRAMIANTEAQRRLHPGLISADAQQIIDLARERGALGWKVNGAGGEGGSLTLLSGPSMSARRAMIRDIAAANPLHQNIPVYLSRYGLRVWTHHTGSNCSAP